MADEDNIEYSKISDRSTRGTPCKICGKFGHVKFECKAPSVLKSSDQIHKTPSLCSHTASKRSKRSNSPKFPTEPAYQRTVVVFNVPKAITDLNGFSNALMQKLNTGIKANEYIVTRPWPKSPWRDQEIQVLFKTMESKDIFESKTTYFTRHFEDSTVETDFFYDDILNVRVTVEFENKRITVRFAEGLKDCWNKLLNQTLALRNQFNVIKVSLWESRCVFIEWGGIYYLEIKDKEDIKKAEKELKKLQK